MEKRLFWIDWLKAIAIFLVVLGHLKLNEKIIVIIYSFHIPLFFIISGFLDKRESVLITLKNGIRGLIIPYISFYILTYSYWLIIMYIKNTHYYNDKGLKEIVIKPLIGMLFGVGYDTQYSTMINTRLWFLVGLFFCKIIYSIFIKISKDSIIKLLILNLCILILIIVIKKSKIDLLFSLDSALLGMSFYTIGNLIKNYKMEKIYNKLLLIIIVLGILTITIAGYNGKTDFNTFNYGKSIILFVIVGTMGSFVIIAITQFLRNIKNKLIMEISTGTIVILALHGIMQMYIINLLLKFYAIGNKYDTIFFIVISLIIMGLNIIPIKICIKYFPIVLGKKNRIKIKVKNLG